MNVGDEVWPRGPRCDVCERPLDHSEPWQGGLDGGGVHVGCADFVPIEDDYREEQ